MPSPCGEGKGEVFTSRYPLPNPSPRGGGRYVDYTPALRRPWSSVSGLSGPIGLSRTTCLPSRKNV